MGIDLVAYFDVLPPLKAFAVLFVIVMFIRLVWDFGGFLAGFGWDVADKWAEKRLRRGVTDER